MQHKQTQMAAISRDFRSDRGRLQPYLLLAYSRYITWHSRMELPSAKSQGAIRGSVRQSRRSGSRTILDYASDS